MIPVWQASWNGRRTESLPVDAVAAIRPVNGWPRGRKGWWMASLWNAWRRPGVPGVVWLDPDVAADPDDLGALRRHALAHPDEVGVALHKLWPASTRRDTWVWGHGVMDGHMPVMSQDPWARPEWFAMGMIYLPGILLDKALPYLPEWQFGHVDMSLARTARENGIGARVVYNCLPKHLHYVTRSET